MKKRLAIIIIIGMLMLTTTGCSGSEDKTSSSNGQLTQEQKLKDFDYMYKILKDNYPYFEVNKRLNGVDWLANKNKYIAQIKATKSDEAYYETLKSILHQLNNGYTLYWTNDIVSMLLNKPVKYTQYIAFRGGSFAVFSKSTGFATLVGEKTGGDGIAMDPILCALPNSGYVFRFPVDMGLTSDGTCNFEHKTEPDIKVSAKVGATFSDDEAIKTVLKLVN
ncbi:S41 family peptidase [Clostridium neuense]|uniref:S41 family peptidase n=1 Tax=Clostridium neuense TaxID=1728934 RepID=A0ABW8TGD7_9CLOT